MYMHTMHKHTHTRMHTNQEELIELNSIPESIPLSPMVHTTTDLEASSKDDESNEANTPLFSNHTHGYQWQEKSSTVIPGGSLPSSFSAHLSLDVNSTHIHPTVMPALAAVPPDTLSGERPFVSIPLPHTAVRQEDDTDPDAITPMPSPTQGTFSSPLTTWETQHTSKEAKPATAVDGAGKIELLVTEPVSPLAGVNDIPVPSLKGALPGEISSSEQT